jgi:hypothetical protein
MRLRRRAGAAPARCSEFGAKSIRLRISLARPSVGAEIQDTPRSTTPPTKDNYGKAVHKLTVEDVPVDSFWSISLYNAKDFFEKNDLNSYSLNNLTAKPKADGSFTVQFGGCHKDTPNCLPIMASLNDTRRLSRPRKEIIDATWKLPEAQAVN